LPLASFSVLSGTSFESYGDSNILLGLEFNSFIQVLEMVFTIEKVVYGWIYSLLALACIPNSAFYLILKYLLLITLPSQRCPFQRWECLSPEFV
jgi:hypothetical protein